MHYFGRSLACDIAPSVYIVRGVQWCLGLIALLACGFVDDTVSAWYVVLGGSQSSY